MGHGSCWELPRVRGTVAGGRENCDMSQISQLDRIDALLQISQLPSRYAFACDSRDMDALVALYVDDVTRPDVDGVGRSPLKAHFTRVLSGYYRTMHQIVGHQIDLATEIHATGKVYCRAEHERGDDWVDMAILYDDEYERRDGVWYFAKRFLHMLHVTSRTERPRAPFVPVPTGDRVPLPGWWPSWSQFWSQADEAEVDRLTRQPDHGPPPAL
jgi:SnoaL-like domain